MKKHCNSAPAESVQKFCFHTRSRQKRESVSTYISEIRSLAELCSLHATGLCVGINDKHIQRPLLTESTLTYTKVVNIVRGIEAAARNFQILLSSTILLTEPSTDEEFHKVC